MASADPGDAERPFVDGWPAHSWEQIEQQYRAWEQSPFDMKTMAELARRVRVSGIGGSLGGIVSLRTLCCMMHKQMYVWEPSLLISPNPDGTFCFKYNLSSCARADDWTATYPAEQVMPAFSRFLARTGWVPEGHPGHEILLKGGELA